jgi:RNA polymerase sigma factor (sigma-70 family)
LLWIYAESGGLNYLKKIVAVRVLSKKSQFYRKHILYKKNKLNTNIEAIEHLLNEKAKDIPKDYKASLKESIDAELLKFDYYERSLFLLYYESGLTYKELSKELGIPKISVFNTVRKVKKQLKKAVNVCSK